MAVDHIVQRNVGDDIAVRDDDIVRTVLLQKIDRAGQRVNLAAVFARHKGRSLFRIGIRRQQRNAGILTGQVPILGVADMVDQGLVLILHQNAHTVDTGVYHVR